MTFNVRHNERRRLQAVRILEELTPLVRFDPNPHFLLGNAYLALKNKVPLFH
jgi:hypothetical protein